MLNFQSITIEYIHAAQAACPIDGVRHIKTLPWLSVVISTRGHYSISLGGGKHYDTEENGCFIAPAGLVQDIIHNMPDTKTPMQMKWIFINVCVNGFYKLEDLYDFPVVLPAVKCCAICQIIDELLELDEDDSFPALLDKNRLGFSLAKALMEFGVEKETLDHSIMQAVNMIRNGYAQKLTIKQLAHASNLSVPAFLQKFKKATGVTPMTYTKDFRLSMASSLLITTSLSIEEISDRIGFYDQFYFSRCFKKKYAVPPSEYRKQQLSYR